MKQTFRAARYIAISSISALLATGGLTGCDSDSSSSTEGNVDAGPTADGGERNANDASVQENMDAGIDTGRTLDTGLQETGLVPTADGGISTAADASSTALDSAAADAATIVVDAGVDSALPDAAIEASTQSFCQGQSGLDFCADFDEANALSPDASLASAWTQLVGTPAELTLSTAQASSAPNSLLALLARGPDPDHSAKVVKMITPSNGVTQAIYEFDMYIANVPAAAAGVNPGGFATDFQFDDSPGNDSFGFRIGVFSNGTGFDHADLEHNHPDLGGPDDITSPIALSAGAWQHVKMVVAYAAVPLDGGNDVAFQLYLNRSAVPDVNAIYPAPFGKAPFARLAAGMVYAFQATEKDWGIYYDNFTLKVQ